MTKTWVRNIVEAPWVMVTWSPPTQAGVVKGNSIGPVVAQAIS